MPKYKIKNIDCAVCAANIEKELRRMDNVNSVSLDFLSSVLEIDSTDLEKISTAVKSVEPGAEVESIQSVSMKEDSEGKGDLLREIILIAVVSVLLLIGILLRDKLHNTPLHLAEYAVFLSAYFISGRRVLAKAFKNIIQGRIFDENFLMTVATGGAIIIHQLPEAVMVMLLYNVGEFVQGIAVNRSRKSVKSLLAVRPDYANIEENGISRKVDPEYVNPGDIIIVKPGEKIPLDGVVKVGVSSADTYALTGEHVPRSIGVNHTVLAGMVNKSGLIKVRATKRFTESSISRIAELTENASKRKAKTERFITTFARYYTPAVVAVAAMIAVVPPLIIASASFSDWIYRALVILVISCPCALVISIPLGYFGGIGAASRKGILVKGSDYLDALTGLTQIVFDKTGTLTKGIFKVSNVIPKNGYLKQDIIRFAAAVEAHSSHPIAKSIIEEFGQHFSGESTNDYREIPGRGVAARIGSDTVLAGSDLLLHEKKIPHEECGGDGTVVHVAVNGIHAGYIVISDELKDGAAETIKELENLNIREFVILSGDEYEPVRNTAEKLGIKNFYSGLLPEEKVKHLSGIIESGNGKTAFVGDGINDAPVLAMADVGIAMGALGSDAAVEASDVVIMTDNLSKVPEAVKLARRTRRIVWQNIIFALAVKGIFILLGGAGLASMWEAVFADMGVAVLAILNATRLMK